MNKNHGLVMALCSLLLISCVEETGEVSSGQQDAANGTPVAVFQMSGDALIGNTLHFDGSASHDPDGDALTYEWRLASAPLASVATLSDPHSATPQFTPDRAGNYRIELVVHDGVQASSAVQNEVFVNVEKPRGIFTSSIDTQGSVLAHPEVKGGLIRATWASLEPQAGQFDFSAIRDTVALVKAQGKQWSLGLIAGPSSPDWLIDDLGVPFVSYLDQRGATRRIPLGWDDTARSALALFVQAVANEFGNDPDLKLVYVPQFTQNGIEGQLPLGAQSDYVAAGWTEDLWVQTVTALSSQVAEAFPTKAIAVELHEVFHNATVAERIMNDVWNDPLLARRVGVGMWWLSGRSDYQADLIAMLASFPGDLYCQIIGRSDEPERFPPEGYTAALDQAMQLGARYVEPWEYEFRENTHDTAFGAFNGYAELLP